MQTKKFYDYLGKLQETGCAWLVASLTVAQVMF